MYPFFISVYIDCVLRQAEAAVGTDTGYPLIPRPAVGTGYPPLQEQVPARTPGRRRDPGSAVLLPVAMSVMNPFTSGVRINITKRHEIGI